MEPRLSVFALIIDNFQGTKFLMAYHQHKVNPSWRFPGGKIEAGETPIGALARELQEELGIVATSLTYQDTQTFDFEGVSWTSEYFICGSYLGFPRIKEPDKFNDLRYMSVNEMEFVGHPAYKLVGKVVWPFAAGAQ